MSLQLYGKGNNNAIHFSILIYIIFTYRKLDVSEEYERLVQSVVYVAKLCVLTPPISYKICAHILFLKYPLSTHAPIYDSTHVTPFY